ncbi:MAG: sugar phosphate isomerase/epimerase family protein, partial [Candidatus Bipolaricaulia bacterium]
TRGEYWTWNPSGLRAEIDFAARVGASVLVVHPGSLGLDRPNGRPDVPEIRRILDHGREWRVRVALENTPNALSALDRALDDLGDDPATSNLGICIDVGHAFLSTDAGRHPLREYLRRYRGQLAHLHLHDTDGIHDSHDVPGRGRIDWNDLCGILEGIHYRGRAVLEVQRGGESPLGGFREAAGLLAALGRTVPNP